MRVTTVAGHVSVVSLLLAAPAAWAQNDAPAPASSPPSASTPAAPEPTSPVTPAAPSPASAAAAPSPETGASIPPEPEPPSVPPLPAPPRKLVEWAMFDFQYLYGFNWNLGPKRKDILTLEHADGWALGDNYLFVDVSHITNQDAATSIYGEWQPRVSLSKLLGVNLNRGPLNDILETNRLAFGGGVLDYLVGGAVDLNIPGFAYWHQHFFVRKDIHLAGTTWQVTSEWSLPFHIGPVRFVQDGFVHFIGAEGTSAFNIITQPQLLLDVGKFGGYEDQLLIGVELDYRHNEFGIAGQNEFVPQAMVEWKL
jgi:nucleoside-specific outer membrane channel protein Tsx